MTFTTVPFTVPRTFGELVQLVMPKCYQMSAQRVDLVCDTYITPPKKDVEHRRRRSDNAPHHLSTAEMSTRFVEGTTIDSEQTCPQDL